MGAAQKSIENGPPSRNAFISYPIHPRPRLGVHLVEPAFRTITPSPHVPFERLKFFENFHPQSLRFAIAAA